jgi:hypothetical protein
MWLEAFLRLTKTVASTGEQEDFASKVAVALGQMSVPPAVAGGSMMSHAIFLLFLNPEG